MTCEEFELEGRIETEGENSLDNDFLLSLVYRDSAKPSAALPGGWRSLIINIANSFDDLF